MKKPGKAKPPSKPAKVTTAAARPAASHAANSRGPSRPAPGGAKPEKLQAQKKTRPAAAVPVAAPVRRSHALAGKMAVPSPKPMVGKASALAAPTPRNGVGKTSLPVGSLKHKGSLVEAKSMKKGEKLLSSSSHRLNNHVPPPLPPAPVMSDGKPRKNQAGL